MTRCTSAAVRRHKSRGSPTRSVPAGRQRSAGFTLLELLVVITIMAILMGILMPVFAGVIEQARQTTCLSNLRQIARAQTLYTDDWDERFPHWYFPASARPEPHGNYAYWTEYFRPYLRCQAVLDDRGAAWIWTIPESEKLAEYSLVTWGRGGSGTRRVPYWNWPGPRHTLSGVRRPAETVTLSCGFTTGGWTSIDLRRHNGAMNVAFVDGHARRLSAEEFWSISTDSTGVWWLRHAAADR